jgi:hypothetical protein
VLVVAQPTEVSSAKLIRDYEFRDPKRRLDIQHVPKKWGWQVVLPTGERLLLFSWVNWRRNSAELFEQFCIENGREFGSLDLDGTIRLGSHAIRLQECRLVHQDEFRPKPATTVKSKSAKAVLSLAAKLLQSRSSRFEDIDCREFRDDQEAHDEELQERLEAELRANLSKHEKTLAKEYGQPVAAGPDEHRDIPINGVCRHVIWTVGRKSLYLALSHEDRELPWVISIGIKV